MTTDGAEQAAPRHQNRTTAYAIAGLAMTIVLAACSSDQIDLSDADPYAPGVDLSKDAVNGIEVGHRLISVGEYELAIDSFTRAALADGMNAEILNGLGTAYLGLGRLSQSEQLLRRAVDEDPNWPAAWNNLGVVLMERDQTAEAAQIFQKAYAIDNGESDSIRDNLRLALAKLENSDNTAGQNQELQLVRQGSSSYVIRQAP